MSKHYWMRDFVASLEDVGVVKVKYFHLPVPLPQKPTQTELVAEYRKNGKRRLFRAQMLHVPYTFVKALHRRRISTRRSGEVDSQQQHAC